MLKDIYSRIVNGFVASRHGSNTVWFDMSNTEDRAELGLDLQRADSMLSIGYADKNGFSAWQYAAAESRNYTAVALVIPTQLAEGFSGKRVPLAADRAEDAQEVTDALAVWNPYAVLYSPSTRSVYAVWVLKTPIKAEQYKRIVRRGNSCLKFVCGWHDVPDQYASAEIPSDAQPIHGAGSGAPISAADLFPEAQAAEGSKPMLTLEELRAQLVGLGWSIRRNCVTNVIDVSAKDKDGNQIDSYRAFRVLLFNEMRKLYKDCEQSTLDSFCWYIAEKNRYNPVLDAMRARPWDGGDWIEVLLVTMRIPEEDTLSRRLVRKWLYQAVALTQNDKGTFGAAGVLVLVGAQGIGKTSIFRKLSFDNARWFGEGSV